jgi:hypothetical protein
MTKEELEEFMLSNPYEKVESTFIHKYNYTEIFFEQTEKGTFCNIYNPFGPCINYMLPPLCSITKYAIMNMLDSYIQVYKENNKCQ